MFHLCLCFYLLLVICLLFRNPSVPSYCLGIDSWSSSAATMTGVFRGFSQSLQGNIGMVIHIGHGHFLLQPLQFIIRCSCYCWPLGPIIWGIDNSITLAINKHRAIRQYPGAHFKLKLSVVQTPPVSPRFWTPCLAASAINKFKDLVSVSLRRVRMV